MGSRNRVGTWLAQLRNPNDPSGPPILPPIEVEGNSPYIAKKAYFLEIISKAPYFCEKKLKLEDFLKYIDTKPLVEGEVDTKGVCVGCESKYNKTRPNQKYCSAKCYNNTYYKSKRPKEKTCPSCGKTFTSYKSIKKYCNKECREEAAKLRVYFYPANVYYSPFLKTRFEVFKRDGFRCRYCGRGVEEGTKLVVDHITPSSRGGANDVGNYITACVECNQGKSDILLSEHGKKERKGFRPGC